MEKVLASNFGSQFAPPVRCGVGGKASVVGFSPPSVSMAQIKQCGLENK